MTDEELIAWTEDQCEELLECADKASDMLIAIPCMRAALYLNLALEDMAAGMPDEAEGRAYLTKYYDRATNGSR